MTSAEESLHGVLPVDKPPGPTSHDVVAMTRRALRIRRVGHSGTLDPFASGLLLLCLGSATRVAEYLTPLPKRYRATVRLGVATDTDDLTGQVLSRTEADGVSLQAVHAVLATLSGDVLQTPPAFSAKRRGGERAYAAARQGRALELEPVRVHIERIAVIRFAPPEVELDVTCGSGTYIRAIARDLGAALGVGGHLTTLRRTAIGAFMADEALPIGSLGDGDQVQARLIDAASALGHLPRVTLEPAQVAAVRHGRAVDAAGVADADPILVTDSASRLVAIGSVAADTFRPRKVLL